MSKGNLPIVRPDVNPHTTIRSPHPGPIGDRSSKNVRDLLKRMGEVGIELPETHQYAVNEISFHTSEDEKALFVTYRLGNPTPGDCTKPVSPEQALQIGDLVEDLGYVKLAKDIKGEGIVYDYVKGLQADARASHTAADPTKKAFVQQGSGQRLDGLQARVGALASVAEEA